MGCLPGMESGVQSVLSLLGCKATATPHTHPETLSNPRDRPATDREREPACCCNTGGALNRYLFQRNLQTRRYLVEISRNSIILCDRRFTHISTCNQQTMRARDIH